jgi:copper chaperone CopZ
VAKLDGVEQVDVSAASGRLVVSAAQPLSDADVLAAVDEAGYEAVPV